MKRSEMMNITPDQINRMNKAELLQLAKAEQKALKDARYRLEKAGMTNAPGYRAMVEKGNISAKKNMSAGELKREIMKGRIQLNYSTGTVAQARSAQQAFTQQMSERFDGELSTADSQAMWKAIDRIASTMPALLNIVDPKYIPKESQQKMFSIMKANGRKPDESQADYIDRLTNKAVERLTADYEERESSKFEEDDFSDYFGF